MLGLAKQANSQIYSVENDSLRFSIHLLKTKDSIRGVKVTINNNSNKSIAIGSYTGKKPSCYLYTLGDKIILLFGGTRPGLQEQPKEWVEILALNAGDSLVYEAVLTKVNFGVIRVHKSKFVKAEKIFLFDYLPSFSEHSIKYDLFQKIKRTFSIIISGG